MVCVVLAGTSCARPRPPNVLVIVIDTLRADRLGAYGNQHHLTPFLDELAEQGTVFVNAYAASSWTVPSVASLMTSRHSIQHHVVSFRSRLADEEVTFAEALQPLRYLAGGFSANFRLLQRLGFAQGFHYWRSDAKRAGGLTAPELRQQGLQWLEDAGWHAGRSQPTLLYFQFMEPHSPYNPPEPYRSRVLAAEPPEVAAAAAQKMAMMGSQASAHETAQRGTEHLYDGEVACIDDQLRVLFAELQRRRFLDNAIVIVTADHGEEFWEHEDIFHGKTLYEESVRVPLIVIAPGYRGGQRVDVAVSLLDVAPTLLDLLELPSETSFEGRSLVPLLEGSSLASRFGALLGRQPGELPAADVILELTLKGPPQQDDRTHVEAIVRQSVKLLVRRDGRREVYDLAADPSETHPNPVVLDAMATTLAGTLDDSATRLSRRARVAVEGETIDEATKEKLRALGYQL